MKFVTVLSVVALTVVLLGSVEAAFKPCMEKCKEQASREKEAGCDTSECISKFMSGCMSNCMTEAKQEAPPGSDFDLKEREDMPEGFMEASQPPVRPPGSGPAGPPSGIPTTDDAGQDKRKRPVDPLHTRPNLHERPPFNAKQGDFGQPSPWKKVDLARGWSHVDPETTFAPVSFHIDQYAIMHFRGVAIPHRDAGDLLFTLPSALAPSHSLRLPCATMHKACYITVNPQGEVYADSYAEWLSVDGVSFVLRDIQTPPPEFQHPGQPGEAPPPEVHPGQAFDPRTRPPHGHEHADVPPDM